MVRRETAETMRAPNPMDQGRGLVLTLRAPRILYCTRSGLLRMALPLAPDHRRRVVGEPGHSTTRFRFAFWRCAAGSGSVGTARSDAVDNRWGRSGLSRRDTDFECARSVNVGVNHGGTPEYGPDTAMSNAAMDPSQVRSAPGGSAPNGDTPLGDRPDTDPPPPSAPAGSWPGGVVRRTQRVRQRPHPTASGGKPPAGPQRPPSKRPDAGTPTGREATPVSGSPKMGARWSKVGNSGASKPKKAATQVLPGPACGQRYWPPQLDALVIGYRAPPIGPGPARWPQYVQYRPKQVSGMAGIPATVVIGQTISGPASEHPLPPPCASY